MSARARAARASPPRRAPQAAASGDGPSPAQAARDYETVVLVLQGGGALGAYQCGVYEALHEAGVQPDWFAGISIGAINAALLAGNDPQARLDVLQEFWGRISMPAVPLPKQTFDWQRQFADMLPPSSTLSAWADAMSAVSALVHGQTGFFVPRFPPPFAPLQRGAAATSFYSTAPLKQTLESLVDFDRINHKSVRLTLGAVNVRTGNFTYFDNRKTTLRAEHVMASGALPPAFAPVEIDGEYYWDGGLVSNTPLEYVFDESPRQDTLALQVDLWSARGNLPKNLPDVLERVKDIQYSSRTRRGTDDIAQRQRLRLALGQLLQILPDHQLPENLAHSFDEWTCTKVLNVIHLIYQSKSYEEQYKDYAFGPHTMREHWLAGRADMQDTLTHPDFFALPARDSGVVTHDIHRDDA